MFYLNSDKNPKNPDTAIRVEIIAVAKDWEGCVARVCLVCDEVPRLVDIRCGKGRNLNRRWDIGFVSRLDTLPAVVLETIRVFFNKNGGALIPWLKVCPVKEVIEMKKNNDFINLDEFGPFPVRGLGNAEELKLEDLGLFAETAATVIVLR